MPNQIMKQRREYFNRHQALFAIVLLACWQRHDCGGTRRPSLLLAHAASTVAVAVTPNPPSSSSASTEERFRNQTSAFFNKFETHGPTLTLTLRDPSTTTLLSGISGDRSKLWSSGNRKTDNVPKKPSFGLSSKLAGLFYINSSASKTNGGTTSSTATSQFADGYMLDDGEIFLDPPSASSGDGSSTSSSRGLFSIRDMGSGILGGFGRSSLAECAQNVHPELRYEMKTREQPIYDDSDNAIDTRPFPDSAPWLSGVSCGMIWSPFTVYKSGYPEGYGHKLMSVPHFIKCGATLSLPRISTVIKSWRSTSRGITNNFTSTENRRKNKELDLGVTYRESPYSPTGDGTLELMVGRSRPSLPPAKKSLLKYRRNNAILDKYRRNNHILVRLATSGQKGKSPNNTSNQKQSILSSIEYAKASLRMPNPLFLFKKGVTISPSFDFVEERAWCVFSGDVGSSGRTRAVLRLDSEDDATLTLVRALDESKIIAPTISLNSGKIVYDYYLNLDNISAGQNESHKKVNSSIRAHVDPTKGIILKWTDGITGGSGGSCWVTECRVPLGTTAPGPLAADVRVGRRWVL